MTLSPNEAANALRDMAAVENRSRRAYGYRQASPYLILWGVMWVVIYGLTQQWPRRGLAIWIVILVMGLAADFAISLRRAIRYDAQADHLADPTRRSAVSRLSWGFAGIALTAFAFVAATVAVMAPVTSSQISAFIALVVAAGCALMGLWLGLRFIIAGVALGALTLGGFFLLPAHFALWMAAIGGGGFILAGFWLREA